ncbi:MAG: hypothetical protein EA426_03870 [Spirochaetaceae bacterium]|nr:MAG: hypothetical protein EA426_03870 [Spirochaetaceae bacterium]
MNDFTELYRDVTAGVEFTDGLAKQNGPGHTLEVAGLSFCHVGRLTADIYAAGTVAREIAEQQGIEMLRAIQLLQIDAPDDHQHGAFRWYREETRVRDTNAAFFTLVPLAILRLKYAELIPDSHARLIDDMLRAGGVWFTRQCAEPSLYYPNKIMSDGALLIAIGSVLEDEAFYSAGSDFFGRWLEYTERRGWGWGENISLGYLGVIFKALELACLALRPVEADLETKLRGHMRALGEILRFHDGQEFVPTIRSYNFDGQVVRSSPLWRMVGVGSGAEERSIGSLMNTVLFGDSVVIGEENRQPVPRTREVRIFDAATSYSWIGHNARLGSLTRFPVMPGSYQWPTWGLGWQSFPVSFSVAQEQVSFLRWSVIERGHHRFHPTEDKSKTYLDPALFGEKYYPDVTTRCSQSESALVVVRTMIGVHNAASSIIDEWIVNRFRGELHEYQSEDGRKWIVLRYAASAVMITSLGGIDASREGREPAPIRVVQDDEKLRLQQVLFEGDETVVHHPRLEAAWCVVMIDEAGGKVSDLVASVTITDESFGDHEVPRASYAEIREITARVAGGPECRLRIDPHYDE